ncbi:MAG TPA: VapE domain-containing protein [Fusobacterium sp.]|uniref:VapE domain-containing protein n=1 Tax=Fusobacterium sp. TaxID=68766 RepID=UPI002F3F3CA8
MVLFINNIKGKDPVSNLVGKVVVELEEFVALRNAKSADEAKLFISARTSTVRLPYERFSTDVKRTCILIATTNDATFLSDFSGERRYLPVKVNAENIQLPLMYDLEKYPILETITRKEHEEIMKRDFEGAIAEAVYIYENKLHDFYLPKELRSDLDFVIQTHKRDNRHIQNFLDFME